MSKIFKDLPNASITGVNTSTVSTELTILYSSKHKDHIKTTQQIHQGHTHSNTPIMPTTPSTTPITMPGEP